MALYITPWVVDAEGGRRPHGVDSARAWSAFDLRQGGAVEGDALVATDAPMAGLAGRETTKAEARQRINAAFPALVNQPVVLAGEVL